MKIRKLGLFQFSDVKGKVEGCTVSRKVETFYWFDGFLYDIPVSNHFIFNNKLFFIKNVSCS